MSSEELPNIEGLSLGPDDEYANVDDEYANGTSEGNNLTTAALLPAGAMAAAAAAAAADSSVIAAVVAADADSNIDEVAAAPDSGAAAPDSSEERKESEEGNETKMSVRVLVGSKTAGGLIGKGGEIIKNFREKSGAWIDIADAIRGALKRIVTVKGSMPQVVTALMFITERLADRKRENKRQSLNIGSVNEIDVKNSLTLLVPNAQVGCIIGKAGAQIRTTREDSGASIKVSEKMLEQSTEKTVTIEGNYEQVDIAMNIISKQLLDTVERSVAKILYQPRPVFMDMYGMGYGGYGMDPYGMGMGGMGMPNHMSPYGYGGQDRMYGNSMGYGQMPMAPDMSQPQQTIVIPVPDALIGSVIGRGGSIIRDIRARSRSQVKIADLQANATDRMITITGTRQSNEIAVALVYEKMNAFDPSYRKARNGQGSEGEGEEVPVEQQSLEEQQEFVQGDQHGY